ncbi:voltage-gated chloride channel [Trichophyton tonsurans CBS 112818]|uniref:Voltage-gated chloride channel protein n=2 Tax=Trichophyton TaxID=5550 RepID=F2PLV8_TRIEC|nr:voltage-gated chloride channel [Trichophyton tonsurans CBS 112818]EGE02876.1 voltage-gated chloride channel protein [Trichophyton equinum CBS 127.97]
MVRAMPSRSMTDEGGSAGGDGDNPGSRTVPVTSPPSPTVSRHDSTPRLPEIRFSIQRRPTAATGGGDMDERTSLLDAGSQYQRSYSTNPASPRPDAFFRHNSTAGSLRMSKSHSRANSQVVRFTPSNRAAEFVPAETDDEPTKPLNAAPYSDDRVWYDQFTSTDWVHDTIADGIRLRELRSRRDIRGKLLAWVDGAQGWVLVAIIGILTACVAYFVDVTEIVIYDLKEGFCSNNWFMSKKHCCPSDEKNCLAWRSWSEILESSAIDRKWIDFGAFVFWAVLLAAASCTLTLLTKTVVPSSISLTTLDEDFGAVGSASPDETSRPTKTNLDVRSAQDVVPPPMVYYSAAGSGVAEVKVILSGFILHGYLGVQTLAVKTLALVLSVASGLSVGKEGPYVHIATCIGNICCRLFAKYHYNDGKRREVLSASAASGVAVAFGAPIGGVLFSLEEVSYYFPPKTLFRTFFCCIAAALSLKFLNPYQTGKIVLFQVRYVSDWEIFELAIFMLLGVLGGAFGALFIKASKLWAQTFRRIPVIKKWPMLEVVLVALITGLMSFWNRYTKLAVSELLFELASPCDYEGQTETGTGLCPKREDIPDVIKYLLVAFIIKSFLTTITFGIKVPAGIYVPSMVVGGLMGRIVGHVAQYFVVHYPNFFLFGQCPSTKLAESCVNPGVYALIAAGSTMCGVTRLSLTLVVILFELTGSLDHVLPFSLAILCAKWVSNAVEPLSIYDLLTDMNSYPFLDNKLHPIANIELGDIVPRVRKNRVIDISNSPLVSATELREKLDKLLMAGELDGGLPILNKNILVGLIPAPELEYALDKLPSEEQDTMCLMSMQSSYLGEGENDMNVTDFTPFIDPSPVSLDIHSPINLVYQCFVKLGLRYMCVLRDGQYAGLVHKKSFVKFMKETEKASAAIH